MSFASSLADLVSLVIEQRDLRSTQVALRESEERYALAVRGANDGLWDWDLQSDVVYYSPRFRELLGVDEPPASARGTSSWLARVHPDDLPRLTRELAALRDGETNQLMNEHQVPVVMEFRTSAVQPETPSGPACIRCVRMAVMRGPRRAVTAR